MAEEKKSVILPDLPKGKEFEEYISSYLQAAGYYLDRNIIDRGLEELLELDIIITDYDLLPRPKLIEIKSGDWGFSDVFKIKGWMTYTEIGKGYFIVQEGKKNYEFYRSKAKELNVGLFAVPHLDKTIEYLKPLLKRKIIDQRDIETLRYSLWLDRQMLTRLKHWKKSEKTKKCYEALDQYYFNINSGVFFTPNIIDRIEKLYDNFKKNGRLTAKCANEMAGSDFEDEHSDIPSDIFKQSFYECKYNVVQISTFLEYLSRIAILKNAVDYLLLKPTRLKRKTEIKIKYFSGITKLDFLPRSFRSGLDDLEKHKYYNRYPIFWQWFLYIFGGFIMLDFKDKEYQLLADKTGIDESEIDNALSAMDILFPTKGGWLRQNKKSNILEAIFFPMPFRGLGANYRRLMYTGTEDKHGQYDDLGISNIFTYNDLIKWNNLTVEILYKK
jgi:hypothetical protein